MIIGIVAIACSASGALSVDEQVKMLSERYRQVEDKLACSIRYTSKDESGGAIKYFEKGLNVDPKGEYAQEAKEALQKLKKK